MSAVMARPRQAVINRWEEEQDAPPEIYPVTPDDEPGMARETTVLTEPDEDFFSQRQPTLGQRAREDSDAGRSRHRHTSGHEREGKRRDRTRGSERHGERSRRDRERGSERHRGDGHSRSRRRDRDREKEREDREGRSKRTGHYRDNSRVEREDSRAHHRVSSGQARVNVAISKAIEKSGRKDRMRMITKETKDGTSHSLAVSEREIKVQKSTMVKGGYVLQKDFDLHTKVEEKQLWQPLGEFEKEPFQEVKTEFVRSKTTDARGANGVVAIPGKEKDFVVPTLKPGEQIIKPLPFFEREKQKSKKKVVPGDLCRYHESEHVSALRGYPNDKRRFLSPREWEHILKQAEQEEREARAQGTEAAAAGADAGPAKQVTFLTEDPAEVEAAEAEATAPAEPPTNESRPWLNKGGGTWRPRPTLGTLHPKSLKVKPKFDPSSYIAKMKQRQEDDAQNRMNALIAGKDPATDPTKWKMRYRERDDSATRAARARAIRNVPKWDTKVVMTMLEESIRTEGYKLQALDQLLMDITKGRRANEQAAQQKVVPTREYIHKVRQRISDLREAASFVRKPTWHDDLKSLRVGGTHGTPLDDFIVLIKGIVDEDTNIIDDTPD